MHPFKWTCEGAEGVHSECPRGGRWGGQTRRSWNKVPIVPGLLCPSHSCIRPPVRGGNISDLLQNQNSQNQTKLFSLFC